MKQFQEINNKIIEIINKQKINFREIKNENYKLPISDAMFCIEDTKRNLLFYQAIKSAIEKLKENTEQIQVWDVGCGSGVFGIFALICGAEKCLFIEHNPNTLQLCKIIVNELGLINNSEFLLIDATTWNPNSKFDLLISETIESTLNFEDFPKIINNLRNYGTKNSIIIPEEFEVILKGENGFYDSKNFICKNGFNKISINIPNNLNEIEFSSNIRLYGNNYIKTHDTYSFVNQRIWKLENKHNFLEFKKN